MLQDVVYPPEQPQIEKGMSSPIAAHMFDFCDPNLFPENLKISEVSSCSGYCNGESCSYTNDLSLSSFPSEVASFNDEGKFMEAETSVLFSACESRRFLALPYRATHNDHFDLALMQIPLAAVEFSGFSHYSSDSVVPLGTGPSLEAVFEEDARSSMPPSYVRMDPASWPYPTGQPTMTHSSRPNGWLLAGQPEWWDMPRHFWYFSGERHRRFRIDFPGAGVSGRERISGRELRCQLFRRSTGNQREPATNDKRQLRRSNVGYVQLGRAMWVRQGTEAHTRREESKDTQIHEEKEREDLLEVISESQQQMIKGSCAGLTSDMSNLDEQCGFGKAPRLTLDERKVKIHRYMKKRNERNFSKKIKYACRKTLVDSRPRVRGRLAKNDEFGEAARPSSSNHEEELDEDEARRDGGEGRGVDVRFFRYPCPHQWG